MADTKLSALTELAATPADTDEVYIRDVSEAAANESKRITIANLLAGSAGATKEFFAPVTLSSQTFAAEQDYHPVAPLAAGGQTARIEFNVPADFSSITDAVVEGIAKSTNGTASFRALASYAANGEVANVNAEQDLTIAGNITDTRFHEVNISGILSSLAASDKVGIGFEINDTSSKLYVTGVRFKYS